jgi:hypothetical protein
MSPIVLLILLFYSVSCVQDFGAAGLNPLSNFLLPMESPESNQEWYVLIANLPRLIKAAESG